MDVKDLPLRLVGVGVQYNKINRVYVLPRVVLQVVRAIVPRIILDDVFTVTVCPSFTGSV